MTINTITIPNSKRMITILFILFNIQVGQAGLAKAQNFQTPNVYLDCPYRDACDADYVRSNVPFVNYVRDQADADIYLRITRADTGGGREYVIHFRGIPPFSDRDDTLTYFSPNTNTSDEERSGLVRYIRIGLLPFAMKTNAIQNLDILFTGAADAESTVSEIDDPWNNWVFDAELGVGISGEESELNYEIEAGFAAERITEDWIIDLEAEVELDRREIELSAGTRNVNRDSWEYDGFIAYSLTNHFSVGLFTEVGATKTGNLNLNVDASPAVELSVFPYHEFQERRWLFRYRITPSYRDYIQTTIFLKDSEYVTQQVLSTQLRYDQPWGRIDVQASASNFLQDWSSRRIEFRPSLNIRLTRGLSFNVFGEYRIISDQISLPGRDITDEERLLGERQQATSYDFRMSFGISYTFGSIYGNIVNPRFIN